jgi:hypothetical protein
MDSVTIERLADAATAIDAADTWQDTPKDIRADSRSQLQFYIDYNPHAGQVAVEACELYVQVLYAIDAADTEAASGGSGSFTWKGYTEEVDQGDGSSLFEIRTWRVKATGTENFDRDPTFSRPIAQKRVKCRVKEVGQSNVLQLGTYSIRAAAQSI